MGINKQNEDEDWFISIIGIFKWIKIFFSPFLFLGIVGLAVFSNAETVLMEYLGIGIIIFGIVCGILLAEYVRKKHGLIEFDARIDATPDLDEHLKTKNEKRNTNNQKI